MQIVPIANKYISTQNNDCFLYQSMKCVIFRTVLIVLRRLLRVLECRVLGCLKKLFAVIIRLTMTPLDIESVEVKLRLEAKHADLAWLYPQHTHAHNWDDVEICVLNIWCMIVSRIFKANWTYIACIHSGIHSSIISAAQYTHYCTCKCARAKKIPSLVWHFSLNEPVWSQHQQAFVRKSDEQNGEGASARVFQWLCFFFPSLRFLHSNWTSTKHKGDHLWTNCEQSEFTFELWISH